MYLVGDFRYKSDMGIGNLRLLADRQMQDNLVNYEGNDRLRNTIMTGNIMVIRGCYE